MAANSEYHLGIMLINPEVTDFGFDLTSVMTQNFGDLTAVYIIENDVKYGFVTKEFCDMNRIRVDELHEAAVAWQRNNNSPVIEPLDAFVKSFFSEPLEGENPFPIYIVTLAEPRHGASVIMQPEILIGLEEKFGGDYFILPSSTHEVLVIPDTGDENLERELNDMVKEVNKVAVSPEERLSDKSIRGSDLLQMVLAQERKIDRGHQR